MNANNTLSQLTDLELKLLITEKIDECIILRRVKMDEDEKRVHKKFVFQYFIKNCSSMTVFDLDTFFLKYNTGDIINDNYANAQCIINGVKVFKSKNAVKGTKFNSKQVEYSRSPENELKVNKCLKDGVIHDKNNIYFTREQMYILDPDFKKQCEENRRQQIIKFKFKK